MTEDGKCKKETEKQNKTKHNKNESAPGALYAVKIELELGRAVKSGLLNVK